MATTKKRLNISLSKDLDSALAKLAKRDEMPRATKAEHLLQMSIEMEEDGVLNSIAEERDSTHAKFAPHNLVWR
jgi:hypothetical protein